MQPARNPTSSCLPPAKHGLNVCFPSEAPCISQGSARSYRTRWRVHGRAYSTTALITKATKLRMVHTRATAKTLGREFDG